MSLVMLVTMVLCFALTISVAVSIGLASVLGVQIAGANMLISVKEMYASINKFPLAAIPFFILAGNIMETGGISRRLVDFAKSLVGGVLRVQRHGKVVYERAFGMRDREAKDSMRPDAIFRIASQTKAAW